MNTEQLKRVRRLFTNDLTPREVSRSNMKAWVRAIRMLGDNWLLAKPMEKADA